MTDLSTNQISQWLSIIFDLFEDALLDLPMKQFIANFFYSTLYSYSFTVTMQDFSRVLTECAYSIAF